MTKNIWTFLLIIFLCLFAVSSYAQSKTTTKTTIKITKVSKRTKASNRPITLPNLLQSIADLSNKTGTVIGVTAIHIETNQRVAFNGNTPFFMASTIKVPIAIALLQRVDQKQDSLNRVVRLTSNNSTPGSGALDYMLEKKPLKLSLRRLLNLMLVVSDNTASDVILQQVNGPYGVTAKLNQMGFHSILVRRSILQMYIDAHGGDYALMRQPHTATTLERSLNQIAMPKQIAAWKEFQNDLRDSTTPNDMAALLAALYRGKLLSSENTKLLLHVMQQCRTGNNRIKGLLPSKTAVAHKTGTWSIYSKAFLTTPDSKQLFRFVSDIGIVTLPKNKGHIAIAIYVKSTSVSDYERSKVIAAVSKKIYDYFLNATN